MKTLLVSLFLLIGVNVFGWEYVKTYNVVYTTSEIILRESSEIDTIFLAVFCNDEIDLWSGNDNLFDFEVIGEDMIQKSEVKFNFDRLKTVIWRVYDDASGLELIYYGEGKEFIEELKKYTNKTLEIEVKFLDNWHEIVVFNLLGFNAAYANC